MAPRSAAARLGSNGPSGPTSQLGITMRQVPLYLDVFNAAANGAAARDAEWRAMHARPDAEPLPEEPPRSHGWLATILRKTSRPAPVIRQATSR
jgi:hypothetical protein